MEVVLSLVCIIVLHNVRTNETLQVSGTADEIYLKQHVFVKKQTKLTVRKKSWFLVN